MTKQKKSSLSEASVPSTDAQALKQLSRTLSLSEHDIQSALQVLASASVFSVAILLKLCVDMSQTQLSWQANMKAHLLANLISDALRLNSDSKSLQSKQVKKLESAFYTLYPELFLGVAHVG